MATLWQTIIRQTLKHVNGILGSQAVDQNTNYTASVQSVTTADDPIYNLAFIKDVCADVEGRLANEIASAVDPVTGIGNHPWRPFLLDSTDPLNSGDPLPTAGSTGNQIVGAWGRVIYNGQSDLIPATPASIERVRNFNLNPQTMYGEQPYEYCLYGAYIYHTFSPFTAIIDVCVFDRNDTVSAMGGGSGVILLPDPLADAYVAGAVSQLVIEEEYIPQASYFREHYQAAIAAIRAGATRMPGLVVPVIGR